jgi:hypothetical protein
LDGHEAFAEWDDTEKRLVGMEKDELARYFPNIYNWPQDRYQAFLERYHRFNREATESDPPEDTWMLVKFVQAHTIQVDSDAEQSLLEGEGRYFDSSGRAIEGRLRRGEDGTVRFEAGETGVFDLETADTLIADGVCEKVKPVYRRPLHDYDHFFRATYFRHQDLNQSIARAERDTAEMKALQKKAEEQLALRDAEKINLEEDYAGFQAELADVTNHVETLKQAWVDQRSELSRLYQQNKVLAAQLTRIQAELARQINRATLQSTSSGTSSSTSR